MPRSAGVVVGIAAILLAVCSVLLLNCEKPRPLVLTTQPELPGAQPATQPVAPPEGRSPVSPPKGQLLNQRLDKLERQYLLYLPGGYKADRQWPLLVLLHGRGDEAELAETLKLWLATADQQGWIVVSPMLDSPNAAVRDPLLDEWEQPEPPVRADLEAANAVLTAVTGRWSVDRGNFMLVGLDWSTKLAARLAVNKAGQFKRAVLISPMAPPGKVAPPPAEPAKDLAVLVLIPKDNAFSAPAAFQAIGYFEKSGVKAAFRDDLTMGGKLNAAAAEFLARGLPTPPAGKR